MAAPKKDLNHHLSLNYPIELIRDKDQGGYFARHPDLLGCTAEGTTPEEAVTNLDESRAVWLEARLESGYPVPEPPSDEYAGRISLRVTPSLHAYLARASVRHGMSLNQLLNIILAEWASGVSVKDKVADELKSLLADALERTSSEAIAVTTETKTETKTHMRLLHGGAASVTAVAEAGY